MSPAVILNSANYSPLLETRGIVPLAGRKCTPKYASRKVPVVISLYSSQKTSTKFNFFSPSSSTFNNLLKSRGVFPVIIRASNRNNPTITVYPDEEKNESDLINQSRVDQSENTYNGISHFESSSVDLSVSKAESISENGDFDIFEKFNIPHRYRLIGSIFLAFVICNMDKVNMSIAIIPMSNELQWSASMVGLIQSSFFWGYALSQLPGGWLSKKFSGEKVLKYGVLVWSLATVAAPGVATFIPALLFTRFLVGLGEGVSPPAAMDLIANTIPKEERSRAVAFVYSGLNIGSVVGLFIAPACIELLGWQSVFYIFGLLGIVWCLSFDASSKEPSVSLPPPSSSSSPILALHSSHDDPHEKGTPDLHAPSLGIIGNSEPVPWKKMISSPAVWAMQYAHFCGNWGHYTVLSWLPTYFSNGLHLNLTQAAFVSMLPPLASVLVSSVAAPFADNLIIKNVNTTMVRKLSQCIAFLSPSLCMALANFYPDLSPIQVCALLTAGIGLSSFTYAGLFSTYQDISPKYASILLGITSIGAAVPGIVGIPLTGFLFDITHSWTYSLFLPCIIFYVSGALVWLMLANSEPIDFDKE